MGEINDVLFHKNGQSFFTAGADKQIKMYEPTSNTFIKRYFFFLSISGTFLNTKKFFYKSYYFRASFVGANQAINRIDLDSEGKHILGASNDSAIRLWSISDQRQRVII